MNDIDHSTPSAATPVSLTRRGLLIAAGSLGLGGCASDSLSLLGATLPRFGASANRNGYPLTDAQIKAIPYASMGVRIGKSQGVVTILASVDGARQHWASADRVVLITEHGRLVKTIGLPRDLLTTRFTEFDPLSDAARGNRSTEANISRIIDLRPKDDFSVPIESRCAVMAEESLTILGETRRVLRVRERMVVRKWRWSTENLYWCDESTGRIWKSKQQFCPDVPAITLEVLRPAAA